ncbi:MAG: Hsp20/alpha crystallin family protein [Verrucomicrobia bacterium]|nr:Hsp20/alpha crystallin family protein [Verrucomicrobiota bacterium]
MQREINRVFGGYGRGVADFPALNVWGNDERVVVTAEIPGVDPKDIELNVVKNELSIQGERKADALAEDVVCQRNERGIGRFIRTVRLPFDVENDKVSAKYDKGVLTVTLPRSESTKPKKISIESA